MVTLGDARKEFEDRGVSGLAAAGLEYLLLRSRVATAGTRSMYWSIAPRYYRFVYRHRNVPPDFSFDPFEIRYVDPNSIRRISGRRYPQDIYARQLFGTVRGGDWDLRTTVKTHPDHDGTPAYLYHAQRFEETIVYQSLKSRFLEGQPWKETELIKHARALAQSDGPVWRGCHTEAEIEQRCAALDELYNTLSEQGFKTQAELVAEGSGRQRGFLEAMANEVLVDIGRNGDYLFANGRHRLTIAKLLEVEQIPVCVVVRHRKWVATNQQGPS